MVQDYSEKFFFVRNELDTTLKLHTHTGFYLLRKVFRQRRRLCGLKENYQVSAFIEKFDDTQYSLWSLATCLWLDYRNGNEYHTKD